MKLKLLVIVNLLYLISTMQMNLTISSKLSALLEKRRRIKNSSNTENKTLKNKQGGENEINQSTENTTLTSITQSPQPEVPIQEDTNQTNDKVKTLEFSEENLKNKDEVEVPDLPYYFEGWIKYSHYMENEKAKEFFKNMYYSNTKKSNDKDEVNIKS
jgi:hypothetical protein